MSCDIGRGRFELPNTTCAFSDNEMLIVMHLIWINSLKPIVNRIPFEYEIGDFWIL